MLMTQPESVSSSSSRTIRRSIRSFVLRAGRLTASQKTALETLWPVYGIERGTSPLDFDSLFGNSAPVTLEIGYGMGGSLAEMAQAEPHKNFVGIEVHPPGIGNLLKLIQQEKLSNLRLLDDDAVHILKHRIVDSSLERVHLYFPDPWHKKKHHKRRIVQADFVERVADKLTQNGIFHLATDWQDYAEQMVEVVQACPRFQNLSGSSQTPYVDRPKHRPVTKFEKRGIKLGHGVWDLIYKKVTP